MRNTMHAIVLIAALLGLAPSDGAGDTGKPAANPVKEFDELRGNWKCVQATLNGKALENIEDEQLVIEITDGKMITYRKGKISDQNDLRIDAGQTPKHIYIGPGKSAHKGIYKVEGDTLTICSTPPRGPRPSEFVSRAEDKTALVVFKRIGR
jgi:uncharacterized protein (TIGR03067 family)